MHEIRILRVSKCWAGENIRPEHLLTLNSEGLSVTLMRLWTQSACPGVSFVPSANRTRFRDVLHPGWPGPSGAGFPACGAPARAGCTEIAAGLFLESDPCECET